MKRVFPALVLVPALLLAACGGGEGGGGTDGGVEAVASSAPPVAAPAASGPSTVASAPVSSLPPGTGVATTPAAGPSSSDTPSSAASSKAGATPASTVGAGGGAPKGKVPDCTPGCNLVMEGDSITQGMTGVLWDKFCADVRQTVCVNSGLSGNRIDQMIETARTDVDNVVGTGANDVLIFWGGTNDMWQKFYSPDPIANTDAAYAATARYISERRSKGWDYILILTHPPMNPGIISGTDHLNDLIRANTAGADAIIDVAADPRLANPFDPVMRADDGIHYRDGGAVLVVDAYLTPAVQGLKG